MRNIFLKVLDFACLGGFIGDCGFGLGSLGYGLVMTKFRFKLMI